MGRRSILPGTGRGPTPLPGKGFIEVLESSGVVGHGGAAFSVGAKWRSVHDAGGRAVGSPTAAEGEPASFKDVTLMARSPHLVLDGAVTASLSGVSGLQYVLTDLENGDLNTQAINCLRQFKVYGDVVWGARTLQGNDQAGSEWKYVPIRRLALFLESSLYNGTQWVVFEPNDERCGARYG